MNDNANTRLNPRIYVASLADENAGRLHGQWIDVTQDVSVIREEIKIMLRGSIEPKAEEFAIQDYEGFGSLHPSPSEAIDVVAAIGQGIAVYGILFAEVASRLGGISSAEYTRRFMEQRYLGKFTTLAEYAVEFLAEKFGHIFKQLPDIVTRHINYDAIAREMENNDEVITIHLHGKVHVFDSNG